MTALFLILDRHDERILHALVSRRRALIDGIMRSITHLGDAWFTIAVVLALALGTEGSLERVGMGAAFTLTLSHLGVQLLKRSISRPRPRLPVGCGSLIEAPDRFSFPSGHAAAALSVALPVAAVLPAPIGMGVLALAAVVGFSRCYLGVHYPGDVVMGWLLAGLAFWIANPMLVYVRPG